jgi:hypothetical protein
MLWNALKGEDAKAPKVVHDSHDQSQDNLIERAARLLIMTMRFPALPLLLSPK